MYNSSRPAGPPTRDTTRALVTMTQCLRSHRGYVVACVSRNRVQSVVRARLSPRDAEERE